MKHCYWNQERGPENIQGYGLHYVEPHSESLARYSEMAKGDEQRLARLRDMYDKPGFTTPSLGWFMSIEDFESGKSGFGGVTKDGVMNKYPELVIHLTKGEAIAAGAAPYEGVAQ